MKIVKVKLKENGYDIVVGSRILSQLGKAIKPLNIGRDAVIVTNPVIKKLYGSRITKGLKRGGCSAKFFVVPDGERSKSAGVSIRLLEKIAQYDVGKSLFIVAMGGGVIGDLAGYVAAVYKRGIPYIQVPTTLLAQIDSAIGGKVAIDLPAGKNLVGAFHQPKIVLSDVSVLKTLNQRQIRNGLAEAVKYGVIRDEKLFNYIARNYEGILAHKPKPLIEVVLRCSRVKADVVMHDEKETKGIRTILNFGHTTGHAIEAACQYNYYHHGEAVALGMRTAADISVRLGLLKGKSALKLEEVLTGIGLPQRIKKARLGAILKAMEHDKKFRAGRNRFVLATKIGHVRVVEGISKSVIKSAIKARM